VSKLSALASSVFDHMMVSQFEKFTVVEITVDRNYCGQKILQWKLLQFLPSHSNFHT
jgi:hypothetical protein